MLVSFLTTCSLLHVWVHCLFACLPARCRRWRRRQREVAAAVAVGGASARRQRRRLSCSIATSLKWRVGVVGGCRSRWGGRAFAA